MNPSANRCNVICFKEVSERAQVSTTAKSYVLERFQCELKFLPLQSHMF